MSPNKSAPQNMASPAPSLFNFLQQRQQFLNNMVPQAGAASQSPAPKSLASILTTPTPNSANASLMTPFTMANTLGLPRPPATANVTPSPPTPSPTAPLPAASTQGTTPLAAPDPAMAAVAAPTGQTQPLMAAGTPPQQPPTGNVMMDPAARFWAMLAAQ